jgi:hypothetical protein
MTWLACFGHSLARFLSRLRHRLSWRRMIWHRTRRSLRRDLWAMEDALAADAPKLNSMFEMFNQLTRYERPMGIEPLASSAPLLTATRSAPLMTRGPSRSRSPRRTRLAAMVTLAALAVVVAACVAASTQLHPVPRSCLVAASAGLTGFRLSRASGCPAYPVQK